MDRYITLSKNNLLGEKMQALVDNYIMASTLVASNEKLKRMLEIDTLNETSWLEFKEKDTASFYAV